MDGPLPLRGEEQLSFVLVSAFACVIGEEHLLDSSPRQGLVAANTLIVVDARNHCVDCVHVLVLVLLQIHAVHHLLHLSHLAEVLSVELVHLGLVLQHLPIEPLLLHLLSSLLKFLRTSREPIIVNGLLSLELSLYRSFVRAMSFLSFVLFECVLPFSPSRPLFSVLL